MIEDGKKLDNIRFSIKEYDVLSDAKDIMVLKGYLGYQDILSSHGTMFTNKALIEAQKTLYNKPLIGVWDITLNDFRGHAESIYDLKNTCIIGLVPETNDLEIVEYKGKMFQKCLIAVWKNYINPDIVEKIRNKQSIDLSIEIHINDYIRRDDGYIQINSFVYDAICLLGDGIRPAMPGSHIDVVKFSEHKDKYDKQYNKIYFSLKNKEGEEMSTANKNVTTDEGEDMKKENKVAGENKNTCDNDKMSDNTISYASIVKDLTSENIRLKNEVAKYSSEISELETQIEGFKKIEYSAKIKDLYSEYDKILEENDMKSLKELEAKYSDFNEFHLAFSKMIMDKVKTFDFSLSKEEKNKKETEKLGKFAKVVTTEENHSNDTTESVKDELYKLANSF